MTISDTGRPGFVWDGTEWVPILGLGTVPLVTMFGRALNAQASPGNAWGRVAFQSISGSHSASMVDGVFTVPTNMGGVYSLSAGAPTNDLNGYLRFAVNGTGIPGRVKTPTAPAEIAMSTTVFLVPGDTVQVQVFATGIAWAGVDVCAFFNVVRVSGGAPVADTSGDVGPWIPLALAGGLTAVAGHTWPPRYRRVRNSVEIDLMVNTASFLGNGSTLATLPVGYRPVLTCRYPGIGRVSASANGPTFHDVRNDGAITVSSGSGSGGIEAGGSIRLACLVPLD